MVAILEVHSLECTECGKTKRVQRLHVHGNLAEIERTYVCPECREAARAEESASEEDAA